MKKISPILCGLVVACLSLLSGCAYFIRKDCQETDWRQSGYEQGAAGGSREAIVGHERRCAEVEVAVSKHDWNQGWADGVRTYCTEAGGQNVGLAGGAYTGICGPEGEREFQRGYAAGLAVYCPKAGDEEGSNGTGYDPGVCAGGRLEASYRQQWSRAIRNFCQPNIGWTQGHDGNSYSGAFPDDLEPRFLEFFNAGAKARDLKSRVARAQRKRDAHEADMWKEIENGSSGDWERDYMRSAEREVIDLTRQLTIIEARYMRF